MIIGGVDLGVRKAAIAMFEDGYLSYAADFEVPRTSRSKELRALGHWCANHLKVCDQVWIEEPLAGRSLRVSLQIAQTAGAVMAELAYTQFVDLVPVSSWKKEVVGNGNANKQKVAEWLKLTYPRYSSQCADSQDRVDATCIGIYGVRVSERSIELEKL